MSNLNPEAPTKVRTEEQVLPTQRVTLKDAHIEVDQNPDLALMIDTISMIDTLSEVGDVYRDIVKTTMLTQGFKYADGNEALATLRDGAGKKEPKLKEVLSLFASKKLKLEDLLLSGVLTVAVGKLKEVLSENEISSVCQVKAQAPSLEVAQRKDIPGLSATAAVSRMFKLVEKNPDRFSAETLAKESKAMKLAYDVKIKTQK